MSFPLPKVAMLVPDPPPLLQSALQWTAYPVRRADKERLYRFVTDGLAMRDCKVVYASDAARAPFYVVFETPGGERHGILAYPFLANTKNTKNRPDDEHRFQIKYGGDLRGILEVAIDPSALITTIFLGIDLERRIFVAADPLMNTPAPMSRSVEFKRRHVEQILEEGWLAWERDRRPARTRDRPSYRLDEDLRTEVLVGGRQDRLLDLIVLERIARGLDPGERSLVAAKLKAKSSGHAAKRVPHMLLEELEIAPEALFDLIEGASRLKMAVRGWVAEAHLEGILSKVPGVTDCRRINAEGQPDISLRWRGSEPILVECKNSLRGLYADGSPKVDFQRTRASRGDPCSRYYAPNDFQVLAACLHAVTESWEFRFALTSELPAHPSCSGRIANMLRISEPLFTSEPQSVFDKCSGVM